MMRIINTLSGLLLLIQLGFVYLNTNPTNSSNSISPKEVKGKGDERRALLDINSEVKDNSTKDSRVKAFLDMIAYAEGTSGPNGYRMQYTGTLFEDDSRHPLEKGICANASVNGKGQRLCSTAAGRYQFLKDTWDWIAKLNSLKDFSPTSQDIAAIFLLKRAGAYEYIVKAETPSQEDIKQAILSANRTWASLWGSPYGQPTKDMNKLLEVYFNRLEHYKKANK